LLVSCSSHDQASALADGQEVNRAPMHSIRFDCLGSPHIEHVELAVALPRCENNIIAGAFAVKHALADGAAMTVHLLEWVAPVDVPKSETALAIA